MWQWATGARSPSVATGWPTWNSASCCVSWCAVAWRCAVRSSARIWTSRVIPTAVPLTATRAASSWSTAFWNRPSTACKRRVSTASLRVRRARRQLASTSNPEWTRRRIAGITTMNSSLFVLNCHRLPTHNCTRSFSFRFFFNSFLLIIFVSFSILSIMKCWSTSIPFDQWRAVIAQWSISAFTSFSLLQFNWMIKTNKSKSKKKTRKKARSHYTTIWLHWLHWSLPSLIFRSITTQLKHFHTILFDLIIKPLSFVVDLSIFQVWAYRRTTIQLTEQKKMLKIND